MPKTTVDSTAHWGMNHAQEEMRKRLAMENMPRWVMEKGPVLMEGIDGKPSDLPQMFREFLAKSVFVLSSEPTEPRLVGIVAQEVKSRNATRKEPEGKWQSVKGLFVDTALMLANVQAYERGSISIDDLLRQYPGYDLSTLKQMMGRLLGRIYYGEIEEKSAIEKRAGQLVYPDMVVAREDREHGLAPLSADLSDLPKHVYIMPYDTYRQKVDMYEKKLRGKRIMIACATGIFALSCGVLEAIATPTVSPSEAVPPTTVGPGTAVSTEKPTTGETQVVPPTATPEVQIGYGGQLSEQAKTDIQEGDYASQIDGVKAWIAVWASQGLVSPESTVTIGFLEDQNGRLLTGIDGGDYWLFPPVVNGEPAYQGAPQPGTPLAENYGPFRVNKVITEQQALDQGYIPGMAKFLDGSAAELRSGMLTRVKNGKVIAYVGERSRRWEKLREFTIANSKAEARNTCNITGSDLKEWMRYVKLNDQSGRFDQSSVIMWPITVGHGSVGGPRGGDVVEWALTETERNPDGLFADPATRRIKRIAYCTLDEGLQVRYVKFLNNSGRISWYALKTINTDEVPSDLQADLPVIQVKLLRLEFIDNGPEINAKLREWLSDGKGEGDFPEWLEDMVLWIMV